MEIKEFIKALNEFLDEMEKEYEDAENEGVSENL